MYMHAYMFMYSWTCFFCAVVTTDFRLNTTSLHMTGGMKKANVTVILIDKGDIVIDKGDIEETKTFQLCLAVAKNESVNEERATVLMKRRCISVSINNTCEFVCGCACE